MRISATIITWNEESNLRRACESLQGVADEVIVVDSESRDRTVEIARQFTPHVYVQPFIDYSKQKNFAASKSTYPWILSLDADECLSDRLRRSILDQKSVPEPPLAAFRCSRLANYLGGWIHHSGWYPDYKVRLYHRDRARWVGEYVHESLAVDGPIGKLDGDLLHYTAATVEEHIERLNRYTTLAARQAAAKGKKFSMWVCTTSPLLSFLKSYVFRLGFLDGWRGLSIASLAAWYIFVREVKLRELNRAAPDAGEQV
ncbi:MAG: glycosyltransferase family 2 protein [Acidobacteriia bacterium]|nr:glycosyltransferase family 2 protein [Terriglobia bacterium]